MKKPRTNRRGRPTLIPSARAMHKSFDRDADIRADRFLRGDPGPAQSSVVLARRCALCREYRPEGSADAGRCLHCHAPDPA